MKLSGAVEEALTPQGGRASIWEMFWEKVKPAKRTAVKMKGCMVLGYVVLEVR